MLRLIYTVLFFILLPGVLFRLYWRGLKIPEYKMRWRERLGVYESRKRVENTVWIHAVSVGEAEAAFPLIKQIQNEFPKQNILVTTTTPSGSKRVSDVLGESVEHVYLPYDVPFIVERFLSQFSPKLALIMEKEMWPNLFIACGNRNIPLFIINARLSVRSAAAYKKIPSLVSNALTPVSHILAQTPEDAINFIDIGASKEKLTVPGNLKFDTTIPFSVIEKGINLKNEIFPQRFVWIAASTHKGEDELLMITYKELKKTIPNLLLLLVPRHPERSLSVKRMIENDSDINVLMRSGATKVCEPEVDVYIADTIGELKMFYAAADISFMGGTLVPVGGHNILEPLAIGIPVIFGPYMENFKEIAEKVIQEQAAIQVSSLDELSEKLNFLYANKEYRELLVEKGRVFLDKNKGAQDITFNKIKQYIA